MDNITALNSAFFNILVGHDLNGGAVCIDFKKYHHLLIGGATGAGKSTILNTITTNLINNNGLDRLGLILIDLKRVELSQFKKCSQCLCFCSEVEKVEGILSCVLEEIERRFETLERLELTKTSGEFPRIFVIIDEFAELILSNKKIEKLIVRISQLGRAAGVHLIICTQLPTAQVVKNLINVNMSSKIALHVETYQNSRAILGVKGAEDLEVLGDAILKQGSKFTRFKPILTPPEDIKRSVEKWVVKPPERLSFWQKIKAWLFN